jgi:sugar transferase (PEP-CTERM/EpsH1 system associated)
MKILWIKAGGLVPPDVGGRIRSYNILLELAKRHSVTLYTFYGEQIDDPHASLNKVFDKVIFRPLRRPSHRGLHEAWNFASCSFSPWPYSVSKYCAPELAQEVRELVETKRHDVVICDFVVAAGVIPWDSPCPKILFTHNVEAQIWQRHYQVASNPLWRAVAWNEYRKMKKFEHSCLQMSDHVLTVSDADRHSFEAIVSAEKLSTLPTGVDTAFFSPSAPGAEQPDHIVFVGAMDWLPNEDGVIFFLHHVFPLVRQASPGATFTVVGRNPSSRLRRIALECGAAVSGRVEDVRPYLEKASVCVVPLRIGSGTRLKIFEAMGMGKAVVSTTVGAEGLPVGHGRNILLADAPKDFAAAVTSLLRDSEKRQDLGTAARELVEQNFSWATVAGVFDSALQRVMESSVASS